MRRKKMLRCRRRLSVAIHSRAIIYLAAAKQQRQQQHLIFLFIFIFFFLFIFIFAFPFPFFFLYSFPSPFKIHKKNEFLFALFFCIL